MHKTKGARLTTRHKTLGPKSIHMVLPLCKQPQGMYNALNKPNLVSECHCDLFVNNGAAEQLFQKILRKE